MHSVWLIISFTVLALFGAITVLPILHKTTQTQQSKWPGSFWSAETLRSFGKMPLIFTLLSANILSGWAWGSAVSWLLITLIFGLLLLPLSNNGFASLDNQGRTNGTSHKVTHGLFLIASLSILIKIIVGLTMAFPEIGVAAMLFITLLALNRYSGRAALLLLIISLIGGAAISANISLTPNGPTWLLELLLSGFTLACLYSVNSNPASKTTLGIINGLGALIVAIAFIAAGLLYSGELSTINIPRAPALPLICLVLLLPGLLPGVDRSGSSKANFSTRRDAITSSHLLIFIVGIVIATAIISMSPSFVNAFSASPPSSPAGGLVNSVISGSIYSTWFAPETIVVHMIEQLLIALPIDPAFTYVSKYLAILILVLGIVQLAIKQLETSLKLFKTQTSTTAPINFIAPWLIAVAVVVAGLFAPDLSLWLACSCSFSVLILRDFCARSLLLSDTRPATRVYLSLSLVLLLSITIQLVYLAVSSGLQKQFSVSVIVVLLLLLYLLPLAEQAQNLVRKLKKTQSSALEDLKNL